MQRATDRRNALVVAALATAFWWIFQFNKHNQVLRKIIPFGDDPYDAVSSFAVITTVLLASISLVGCWFPQWVGRGGQRIYVLRGQAAVPFCVLITVSVEVVAMARHTLMWVGARGSILLLMVQAATAGAALVVLMFLSKGRGFQSRPLQTQAALAWIATLLTLVMYPERLILRTSGHLLTVVLGAVFLFAPLSALLKAWLPEEPPSMISNRTHNRGASRFVGFAVAAVVGLLIGALAFFAELREEASRPAVSQLIFVGSVFIGLGASGVTIGYFFLGRLLGFFSGEPQA